MTKAAIQGDYCDLKFIKSRKVAVISIEIPIEAATAFVAAFGTPNPATGVPVALARLAEEPKPAKQKDVDYGAEFDAEMKKPEKPRRSWSELSRAEQAGIACADPEFRRFIVENHYPLATDETTAAQMVRKYCRVDSRADLDHLTDAAKIWDKLYSSYEFWRRGAAA